MAEKPKLAMYWAASCGGCEISLVNLHENIVEVDRHFDFVFCPCLMDTKVADVESWPDGSIALTLFNGAIRTDENLEMARLLRRKTATLIAFGACAATGGIPALSNLHSRAAHFASIYGEGPSLDNAAARLPSVHTAMPEGGLELPSFHERVKRLEEVVAVDYTIPGCPPEPHQIWNVVKAVIEGAALPPRGSVLGAGQSTVCEECVRPKQEKRITAFRRNFEVVPDATTCLLEQGLLCMGPATRDGCRALCPRANMPCTGCYGPPEGVRDQGAKMIAALGSVVDFENCRGSDEERLALRIESVCDSLPDAAGTFYRYSLAAPILDRR